MPEKRHLEAPGDPADRETRLEQLLADLYAPNAQTRAKAVRQLCPCRRAWVGPEEENLLALRSDPDLGVRQALDHVLIDELREDPRPSAWRVVDDDPRRDRGGESIVGRRPRARGWRRSQLPGRR
jgi:hypothetical protein